MPLTATQMHAKDALFASLAECYVTIDGERYNFAHAVNLEATGKINKVKVGILGRTSKGNKAGGIEYTGKCTLRYNQSVFRKLLKKYQDTATDTYFTIQVRNEDSTSSVGGQTIILNDCCLDEVVVAKFDVEGEILDEDVSFTFENFSMPEEFTALDAVNGT